MKHFFLLLIFSTSGSYAQVDPTAFRFGRASNAEEYCSGLYTGIQEVNAYISRIEELEFDLPTAARINELVDSCILAIQTCRTAISKNAPGEWPKHEFLIVVANAWLDKVENMFTHELRPLAEVLSKPEEQWNAAEIKLYDKWDLALDSFTDFDQGLKDFVRKFAKANNFDTPFLGDPLTQILDEKIHFEAATASFRQGNATSGEEYFSGLLSEIILVDVAYRTIEELDEADAPVEEIRAAIDKCLADIHASKLAIAAYDENKWPKQNTFNLISFAWLEGIAGMAENYAKPLAEAMSKPDDQWTDEEYSIYESWQSTYEVFLEVDAKWVAFQHEYAEANGFTLSNETIDVDALIEK
ncbi:MAG: hypothetical protein A3D92_00510 [Bacteroidetes bacterium RIFCSPHIGHO2_02_FULL_44_7]|nr:MAG: hypothetical protein A3D92_00510 [Bacteroidetes bacterium RIFCSPHIGHO2_02_FULL_44_7]